jgi:hypothetical protein
MRQLIRPHNEQAPLCAGLVVLAVCVLDSEPDPASGRIMQEEVLERACCLIGGRALRAASIPLFT